MTYEQQRKARMAEWNATTQAWLAARDGGCDESTRQAFEDAMDEAECAYYRVVIAESKALAHG